MEAKLKPRLKKVNYLTAGMRLYSTAIALRYDVYHGPCENACWYCYANCMTYGSLRRLGRKADYTMRVADVGALAKDFQRIFDRGEPSPTSYTDWAIWHRWFPEVGTMAEQFLPVEARMRLTYSFLRLLDAYKFPMFINTKGNLLCDDKYPEYYDALLSLKRHGLIVGVTLVGLSDKLKKIEPNAPSPQERLKLIERLCDDGVNVVVSCRPIIAGMTDEDFEGYIRALCEAGVKSIHMRTLVLTGNLLKHPYWKRHIKEHGMMFKHLNYRYPLEYFMGLVRRAQAITHDYGVAITGSHSLFFELEGASNKTNYKLMGRTVQKHLFPFTTLPILERLMKRRDEPKLLLWGKEMKPLLEQDHPFLRQNIEIGVPTAPLIWSTSCMRKPRSHPIIPVKKIISNSIWDGWGQDFKVRRPYIATIKRIKCVAEGDKIVKDDNGHPIFAYIPPHIMGSDMRSTHYAEDYVSVDKLKEVGIW